MVVPITTRYPRVLSDVIREVPEKVRFMDFGDVGEIKIDANKGELFLIWNETVQGALINVCLDISDADTKKWEVDGLRNAMHKFNLDNGLIITLHHSETISVEEGVIEFLPYRR